MRSPVSIRAEELKKVLVASDDGLSSIMELYRQHFGHYPPFGLSPYEAIYFIAAHEKLGTDESMLEGRSRTFAGSR